MQKPSPWRLVAAVLALLPPAAAAQGVGGADTSRVYANGVTGAEFQAILQDFGQETDLSADKDGDPLLRGRMDGLKFEVMFYGCDKASPRRCLSYQYYLGFTGMSGITLQKLNDWNAKKRFGQAARRKDGAIELRLSANIDGGVSYDNFGRWYDWWGVALKEFREYIDFK